jgi:hypothetical protein
MSLYMVHVRIIDGPVEKAHRMVGPYRSEEAAMKVVDLVRGRVYTRLIKNKSLLGRLGDYPHLRVAAEVHQLHGDAAKYHYDWAESQVMNIIND